MRADRLRSPWRTSPGSQAPRAACRRASTGSGSRDPLVDWHAPTGPERMSTERAVAAAQAALGEDVWSGAFSAGKALTSEQAIAYGLE